jgi:hypothetical protein
MDRRKILGSWMCLGLLTAGLGLAPAYAETGMGSPQMSGTMHDMASQMMSMSAEMTKGHMSGAQQKHMAGRMKQMATMMDEMSGMAGKGMMMDADMQKRMDRMRNQMDQMMKGSPAPGGQK